MYWRFERTRIISARALQLSLGAPALVKIPSAMIRAEDVAKLELDKEVLPISVIRIMPDGKQEIFDIEKKWYYGEKIN